MVRVYKAFSPTSFLKFYGMHRSSTLSYSAHADTNTIVLQHTFAWVKLTCTRVFLSDTSQVTGFFDYCNLYLYLTSPFLVQNFVLHLESIG